MIVILISVESALYRLVIGMVGLWAVWIVLRLGEMLPNKNYEDEYQLLGFRLQGEWSAIAAAVVVLVLRGFIPLIPLATALVLTVGASAFSRLRMRSHSARLLVFVTVTFLVVGGTRFSHQWSNSEAFWFWLTHDQMFRTSLATGLTRWGYGDLNSATGLTLHYHWLSEGFAGILSRLGGIDEFVVVTRVLPTLAFMACFLAMWKLLCSIGVGILGALFGTTITCLVLLEVDPYSIGTLMGAAVVCRIFELLGHEDSFSTRNHSRRLVLLTILMMVQTPFGLVVTATILLELVRRIIFPSINRSKLLFPLLSTALVPLILRITLLQPGDGVETSGSVGIDHLLSFGGFNVPFGLEPESSILLRGGNSVAYLLETLVLSAPGLYWLRLRLRKSESSLHSGLRVLVSPLCVATLILANFLEIGVAQGKLFSVVLLTLLPLSLGVAFEDVVRHDMVCRLIAVASSVLAIVSYRTARTIDYDPIAAVASVFILLVLVAGMFWVIRVGPRAGVAGRSKIVGLAFVCLPLVGVLGISVGRQDRVLGYLEREPIPQEVMVGSAGTRNCLEWLRQNTSESEVIATDIFDPKSLPGSEKSYLVSALTKRRVWIDGLYNSRRYFAKEVEERVAMLDNLESLPPSIRFFVLGDSNRRSSKPFSAMSVVVTDSDCIVLRRN